MVFVYILLGLIVLILFIVLFAFLIGEGFKQKFGKYDMPNNMAREFIKNLLPDIEIPEHLFPFLIEELKSMGFKEKITQEEVKLHLQKIICDEIDWHTNTEY